MDREHRGSDQPRRERKYKLTLVHDDVILLSTEEAILFLSVNKTFGYVKKGLYYHTRSHLDIESHSYQEHVEMPEAEQCSVNARCVADWQYKHYIFVDYIIYVQRVPVS